MHPKIADMQQSTDPRKQTAEDKQEIQRSPEEIKQEQTDPNLTELKGFIDPKEKLEPEGTDNDFDR